MANAVDDAVELCAKACELVAEVDAENEAERQVANRCAFVVRELLVKPEPPPEPDPVVKAEYDRMLTRAEELERRKRGYVQPPDGES